MRERDASSATRRGKGWIAICLGLAVAITGTEARAGECTLATPECHLENGKRLLKREPRRAAEELLASYRLDERTDTLVLYANALELDRQYALALETWQRVIVFRESEVVAAEESLRTARGKKLEAARAAGARAKEQMEQAAEAIMKLWPNVGRVRVRVPAGEAVAVSRGGVEVDVSREVIVNAGRDELVFKRRDGSVQKLTVEVGGGQTAKLDAPKEVVAIATRPPPKQPEPVEEAEERDETPAPAPAPAATTTGTEALGATRTVEVPRSRTLSRVGLGLVAGAIAAGGAAAGFAYIADRDYDRSRTLGCAGGQCPFGPGAELAERSNDRARIAQLSAIGGGALLVTGVTLWIVGRGTTRRPATDVAVHVDRSSAAVAWRF